MQVSQITFKKLFTYLYLCWICRFFSSCGAVASHCGGFSSCSSQAVAHGLSSCGAWAWLPCGMWDIPGPGIKLMSPTLAGRFFIILCGLQITILCE